MKIKRFLTRNNQGKYQLWSKKPTEWFNRWINDEYVRQYMFEPSSITDGTIGVDDISPDLVKELFGLSSHLRKGSKTIIEITINTRI